MTEPLNITWLAVFLTAHATAVVLLHIQRDTASPKKVFLLALTLIFIPPAGLLVVAFLWIFRRTTRHGCLAVVAGHQAEDLQNPPE